MRRHRVTLFVLRRIAQAIPLIFAIIIINFTLIHAAPGDPATILIGQMDASPEYIEQVRKEFGLDRPLLHQLGVYVWNVLHLDLGYSLRYRQDVTSLILSRLPATLLLMGTALVLSSVIGITLGALASRKPYSMTDNSITFVSLVGYSMPVFWLGQLLLLGFALWFPLFPVQGMYSLRAPSTGLGHLLDLLWHLALPALTYSVYHLTLIYRLTRVKMRETLTLDFITTARAKGVSERGVVWKHALPNALLPIVTAIGLNFGFMLAGSVLTETVFAWPGTGRLLYEAIMARDYPVLLGLFTVLSVMVVIANMLTDLLYAVVDPRVVQA